MRCGISCCVQVRILEQSLGESTQRLQQLQMHLQHVEEQASTHQLHTSEHIQRLQALHADGLIMKQQEVVAAAGLYITTEFMFTN